MALSEVVLHLSPSAKIVLQVIKKHGKIKTRDLVKAVSEYAPRTVRTAIYYLVSSGIIKRVHDLNEMKSPYLIVKR